MNISLWIAQILLAASYVMGTVMKFMPVKKIETKMAWMGQVPVVLVRLLGVVDLVAAAGLILPMLLNRDLYLTSWAAMGSIVLMLSAIIFHISRGEKSSIGFNIFILAVSVFVAWGRLNR